MPHPGALSFQRHNAYSVKISDCAWCVGRHIKLSSHSRLRPAIAAQFSGQAGPHTWSNNIMQKNILIDNLNKFIKQRPGLDFGNYGDIKSYRAELRGITKDYQDARELLAFVSLCNGITAIGSGMSDIIAASTRAFAGRLEINEETGAISYTTGQYWPTEYRAAVCSVLAAAIWAYFRESGHDTGDSIRKAARAEFGRGIAGRWFI